MIGFLSIFLIDCVYHYCIVLHQKAVLKKLWKMLFISAKMLFCSMQYSNFPNFSPSCPKFYDFRRRIENRIITTLWKGLHKLPIVIFGKNPKPLTIKESGDGQVMEH